MARREAFDRVDVVEGRDVDHYEPPAEGTINVFVDGDRPWLVTFLCPCRCTELVMVPLVGNRWRVEGYERGEVTLSPSVHRTVGCRSHFFVQANRVEWC